MLAVLWYLKQVATIRKKISDLVKTYFQILSPFAPLVFQEMRLRAREAKNVVTEPVFEH